MENWTAHGLWGRALLAMTGSVLLGLGGCSALTGLSELEKCEGMTCGRNQDGGDDRDGTSGPDASLPPTDSSVVDPADSDDPQLDTGELEDTRSFEDSRWEDVRPFDTNPDTSSNEDLGGDVPAADQTLPEVRDSIISDSAASDSLQDTPIPCSPILRLRIDDMEGESPRISRQCGRDGAWYTMLDNLGSTMLPVSPAELFTNTQNAYLRVYGTRRPNGLAAVGFNFRSDGTVFDLSRLGQGIQFQTHTSSAMPFKVRASIVQANTSWTACSPACTHPGYLFTVEPTSEWMPIRVPFAELVRPFGPDAVEFDRTKVTGVLFSMPEGTYDFQVDDLVFY